MIVSRARGSRSIPGGRLILDPVLIPIPSLPSMLSSRLSARRIYSAASHRILHRSTTHFVKSIATSAPNVISRRPTVQSSLPQRAPSSLQQQIRNACSCASHNTISATHVLDGTDKSVMSICQGGHIKPQQKERDAYRLPTNGELVCEVDST